MSLKVLILGATGFVGRNLVEHLSRRKDLKISAVYHKRPAYECPGVTWHQADLRVEADVRRALQDAEIVIQAAATTSGAKEITQTPYIHVTDNAVMNSLLLRTAYELKIKHFFFFSCSIMYEPMERPVREDDFNANKGIFPQYFGAGWTKVYVEKMCEFFAGLSDMKMTVIRHSNVYGPYDKFDLDRSHMMGATITKVMDANNGDAITVWGDGQEGRDVLYIDDLINFVEAAMARQPEPFGLYNAGAGVAQSVTEIVQKAIDASGKELAIEYDHDKPNIPVTLALDSSKAHRELGWQAQTSLEEGLRRTMAWLHDAAPPDGLT